MEKTELVIFDCDGVLVDSEILAAKIEAKLLNDAGIDITSEEIAQRYSGLTFKDILLDIEKKYDVPLSASILDMATKLFDLVIASELTMIEGADRSLKKITLPKCICSNSTTELLNKTLKKTNIFPLIAPHIFSSFEVGTQKGKPDPNVFLYAAQKFKANPANTIVIEDSVPGVMAARSAGMRVIGFTGGGHAHLALGDQLTEAGAEIVINRHALLPQMIDVMDQWRDE
jgi:HAD superfamily hydrolase (TIGR01509 family)